jgi:hypothetical protein
MSDDPKRRCGRPSRYLNGGTNALMRAPSEPDDRFWTYTPAQLARMDARFVARLERAPSASVVSCAVRPAHACGLAREIATDYE